MISKVTLLGSDDASGSKIISNRAQYVITHVKFVAKKSKCVDSAQEIGLSASNSCNLPWLLKGTTQFCTPKK
jgi:hypothetical protein